MSLSIDLRSSVGVDMVDLITTDSSTANVDEMLRYCGRVSPSIEAVAGIKRLAAGPLDWELLFERSWWHRIRPLTYRHLRRHAPGVLPPAVNDRFIEQTTELAERNQRLLQALHEVASYFAEAGIRVLVFKGPTLALDAYGDLSLRECGDLDLLLHRHDFPRAAELLEAHRFQSSWGQSAEEAVQQVFACEYNRDGVQLDVHWDLAPGWLNYQIDFDQYWEAGSPAVEDSHFVRKIRPEDSIVVLSVHGAKHWWERLRWIGDIAELVNSGQVEDWDRVEVQSSRSHSRRSVELGLWLARHLLDAALPDDVARRIDRRGDIGRMGRQVVVWLSQAEQAARERSFRERFSFRMALCERWRDRGPQIWRYLRERPARSH